MVMFSTFEHSVDFTYRYVIQKRKDDCSRAQQLGVTCLAGYAAGSIGSFISNPADNIVSSLYNKKADTVLLVNNLIMHYLSHTEPTCYHCFMPNMLSYCVGCEENWILQSIYKKPPYSDYACWTCDHLAMAIL